jgi:phosphoglycolate phosphatase-like HAD superfamily hydrolase
MVKNGLAVVFDFDGTLIDSRDVKTQNYLRAVETIFQTPLDARTAIIQSCERNSGANRFIQLSDTLEVLGLTATDEQKEAWSKCYSAFNSTSLAEIPEFPSVRPVLLELKGKGVHLFAASGILEEEFLRELSRRKLFSLFQKARGGDKPGFLKYLKGQGYWPILFVGDTSYDQQAAEEAEVWFFKVENDEDIREIPRFLETSRNSINS